MQILGSRFSFSPLFRGRVPYYLLGDDSCELELELICTEYSAIPPYVLSLEIAGDGNSGYYVDETILRLPLLSNLKTLRLQEIDMADLPPDGKKRLAALLQNLTTLDLDRLDVRNCFSLYLGSFCLIYDIGTV